jgi:hypothetical protein
MLKILQGNGKRMAEDKLLQIGGEAGQHYCKEFEVNGRRKGF